MSLCLLCLKKSYKIKTFEISHQLSQDFTIKAAIQEYFKCFKIIFTSESNLICNSCYDLLKTFHEFVIKVNNLYSTNLYDNPDLQNYVEAIENDEEEYIIEDIIEYDAIESIESVEIEGCDEKSEYLDYVDVCEANNMIDDIKKEGKFTQSSQNDCNNEIGTDSLASTEHSGNIETVHAKNSQESIKKSQKPQIHLVLPKNCVKIAKDKIKFVKIIGKSDFSRVNSGDTNAIPPLTQESQMIHEKINNDMEHDQQITKIFGKNSNVENSAYVREKSSILPQNSKSELTRLDEQMEKVKTENDQNLLKFNGKLSNFNENSSNFICPQSSESQESTSSNQLENSTTASKPTGIIQKSTENTKIPSNPSSSTASRKYPMNNQQQPSKSTSSDQKIRDYVHIKCHICGKEFETFSEICDHFRQFHSNQKPFLICCDRKFTHRKALLDHLECHDKSKIHKCETCQKEFKTAAILKSHGKKIHSNVQESSACAVCGKNYTNKYILKTHMRKHIFDSEKSFECYKCRRPMKNLPHLHDHFKYKHDPAHAKSSICHICSKVVTRLDIHLRQMHPTDPIERVKCDICGHWMKKSSFKGHVAGHNETGFDCQICGKFLKNKNSFLCHMKRVHTEGKFKCDHCDKTFHQENRLADHVACQHTGNYLYRCRVEDCGRMFRNSGRRRMHERRMHPKEYEKNFKASYLRENVDTGKL